MEYQKNNKLVRQYTKSTKYIGTKNWIEVNDESRGTHDVNSQIKFKTCECNCNSPKTSAVKPKG